MSSARLGLRLVRWAIGAVVAFVVAAGGYLVWAALANPDVRLKQPRWVEGAFDHSYWIPVLVVTLGGAALVGLVLWTAYRRLRAGEDLYEGRSGRGVRRRGERFVDDEPAG
ncbi:hypothetical protein [Rubrivirga sp.]|uniref:hypothetical protein n=1 Tax=Rubrivirga sp. TaxID=1885344 RepID=UPI003B51933B